MGRIENYVITHKEYGIPSDRLYRELRVGRDDAEGDSISERNAVYSELTGVYWAWKNRDSEYLGFCHYRRLWGRPSGRGILTYEVCEKLLEKWDMILPRKRHYVIETNYSHYKHAHHIQDLEMAGEIIKEKFPQYSRSFQRVMKRTYGHRFNMMIMKRELADEYLSWLFSILFELESRMDISGYSQYDRRVCGFVAERLMDVWLEHKGYSYMELPVIHLEGEHKLARAFKMIWRKITRR